MCIYLKATTEKNWCSQNFDLVQLKDLSPSQFLGSSNSNRYHSILKLLVATQKSEAWELNCVESKSSCILLNKNTNFNKNETESKIENPTHSSWETNLVLQLLKESQIKSKTVMSWNSQKKKEGIFCTSYFVQRKSF